MTHDPITISKNALAIEALKLMENNRKKSIGILLLSIKYDLPRVIEAA